MEGSSFSARSINLSSCLRSADRSAFWWASTCALVGFFLKDVFVMEFVLSTPPSTCPPRSGWSALEGCEWRGKVSMAQDCEISYTRSWGYYLRVLMNWRRAL